MGVDFRGTALGFLGWVDRVLGRCNTPGKSDDTQDTTQEVKMAD